MVAASPIRINTQASAEIEATMELDRSAIIAPPGITVTSPGRIAAAGSTEMFDELQHVVYGTSNSSEVYELITSGAWENLENLVKGKPSLAKEWIGQKGLEATEFRRLPIHEACVKLAPLNVIRCLIEANAKGLQERDHAGRLPLHHACTYGQTREVIELLLMEFPEAINQTDKWQRTPTMSAEFSKSESRNDALELLSKGAEFHSNRKLELNWTKQQNEKNKKKEEEHNAAVQKLKEKMLAVQEESVSERLGMQEEIVAYQTFLGDMDKALGINQSIRSPRGKKQIKITDYKACLEDQVAKLQAHREFIDEVQASLRKELAHSQEVGKQLSEKNESLAKQLELEIEGKRSVTEELETKTQNLLDVKTALDTDREEKIKLSTQLLESRSKEESLKAEVEALTETLAKATHRIENFDNETSDLRTSAQELEVKLEEERATIESLEKTIRGKDNTIAALEDDVMNLSLELEEAMKTYSTLEDHIADLQAEVGPLTNELKAEKESNCTLLQEVEDMRKNQKEMQNIVASSLASEAGMKKILDGVNAKVDNMKEEYSTILEELKASKKLVAELRQSEAKLHAKIDGFDEKLEEAAHKHQSEIRVFEEKIKGVAKKHQDEKHEWFEAKKKLEETISELRCETLELKAENEGLEKQVEDSNEKVVQLGQAAQEARVQISKTIATLTSQKEEAEFHAEKLARSHAKERHELVGRIADLESATRDIERAKCNEQIKAVSAIEALEEALEVAATENSKILKQILESHKRHTNTNSPRREMAARPSSLSPRRKNHQNNKPRFQYAEGSDEEGEY